MERRLQEIKKAATQAIEGAADLEQLEAHRREYLGKKGALTNILRGMRDVAPEDRPRLGELVNTARNVIETLVDAKREAFAAQRLRQQLAEQTIDVTLPGRKWPHGHRHPLTLILDEIKTFFMGYGFQVVEGPEIETDYYNFEALNVPKDHPARDMQDTFYLGKDLLLRTQTSPVQVRTMEADQPPIRIIAPGRVYRVDTVDATHSPMFQQVEGLLLDEDITLGDLKGLLTDFARQLFGTERGVRFRPSYFPFTEPSAEMDISCMVCHGDGCRICSHEGWIEILGCGMVHPNVLEMVGYNPERVGGFAFGLGVERVAMLKYGVTDIRHFFDNDVRFLQQF